MHSPRRAWSSKQRFNWKMRSCRLFYSLYNGIIGTTSSHVLFCLSRCSRQRVISLFRLVFCWPRPKISQKVKSFFVWTQLTAQRFAQLRPNFCRWSAESKDNYSHDKLISFRLSFDDRTSLHFFANSKIKKHGDVSDDVSDDVSEWL